MCERNIKGTALFLSASFINASVAANTFSMPLIHIPAV